MSSYQDNEDESDHSSCEETERLDGKKDEETTKRARKGPNELNNQFHCIIERPQLYVNDEKTRSFLGLKISTGEDQLQSLTSLVDQIFDEFSLPKFYENPSFHVSVAWCLGDIFSHFTKADEEKLQAAFDSVVTDESSKILLFDVKEVKCKIGNKLFSFPLSEQ
ncbi:hypothetical protein QZH41_011812 [Actinostola sp. cb2023]|nr:hypothetical protein QZH41_011812 [Actinostola sp. cb2023]